MPVIKYIKDNKEDIVTLWKKQMDEERPEYSNYTVPHKTMETANENFIDVIFDYLNGNGGESSEGVNVFIEQILQFGWPLSYLTSGLQVFRKVVMDVIDKNVTEAKDLLGLYKRTDAIIDPIFNQLIKDATETWEHTVSMQKSALLELSAPLIPIMEHISVMPLIGTIDTERAKLIMENLLQGVIDHGAEVVLIDITGVPVVDTMVAHHIIQASEAVRLVGSECILVGIRPEIAQTIVNLGIELGEFPTRSTLRKGIETALEMTKRKIINIAQEDGQ
ncbi:rsbT co-antagonist protein RsbR [Scopulibacillus darangshiensis]|uniref:RsbT co-antagonist protein RsbR n=1 Tax=Scopulibacillus darangshiensis TaxID=442528 RepID=A0A4V2SLK9_9BACL|nr:STAS domain-containing protein [Scopulibacillus darangshiensis]TCP23826.1 rsbT co-antagonist protein RsbR [Scopulibacillus darangshiensis]